jgi:hypothetical protein
MKFRYSNLIGDLIRNAIKRGINHSLLKIGSFFIISNIYIFGLSAKRPPQIHWWLVSEVFEVKTSSCVELLLIVHAGTSVVHQEHSHNHGNDRSQNKSGYDVTIWSFPKTSHLHWNWKLSILGVFSIPRIWLHHGLNVFLWL